MTSKMVAIDKVRYYPVYAGSNKVNWYANKGNRRETEIFIGSTESLNIQGLIINQKVYPVYRTFRYWPELLETPDFIGTLNI